MKNSTPTKKTVAIDVATALEIQPAEIVKYLKVKIGDIIVKDSLLAVKKKGPLGFKKTEIKSPLAGVLTQVNDNKGQLLIETVETEEARSKKQEASSTEQNNVRASLVGAQEKVAEEARSKKQEASSTEQNNVGAPLVGAQEKVETEEARSKKQEASSTEQNNVGASLVGAQEKVAEENRNEKIKINTQGQNGNSEQPKLEKGEEQEKIEAAEEQPAMLSPQPEAEQPQPQTSPKVNDATYQRPSKQPGKMVGNMSYASFGFGQAEGEVGVLKAYQDNEILTAEYKGKILVIPEILSVKDMFKASAVGIQAVIALSDDLTAAQHVGQEVSGKAQIALLVFPTSSALQKLDGKMVRIRGGEKMLEIVGS